MKVKALLLLVLVVAFVSSCEVVTEPDLSVPQVVFEDEFADYWPSLSPDGRYLAFLSDRDGDGMPLEYVLCVYNFETKTIDVLTELFYNNQYNYPRFLEWSIDGQWLYFIRDYYKINGEGRGTHLCQIPHDGRDEDIEVLKEDAVKLGVHPDGETLAILFSNYPEERYIASIDIASGELTPLESTTGMWFHDIKYTQDASAVITIINSRFYPEFDKDILLFPLDGSEPQEIVYLGWDGCYYPRISVSPSGEYIIVTEYTEELTIYPINGGEPVYPLPSYIVNPVHATWEDDGYIYFSCENNDGIWRFKPEL